HDVTNLGHDRTQLEPMALKALAATGCEELTALADRGYFNGEQVLACEGTGILPCIPKTVWTSEGGFFSRHDFTYDAEKDHYICPAGQTLTKGLARSDRKDDIDHYRHLTACFTCALKPKCTPDKLKRLKRWRHELRRIFGDGVNQAADLVSGATSIPSRNLTPLMTFGN